CLRGNDRIGAAMSAGGGPAIATRESSGWEGWGVGRATTGVRTGGRLGGCAGGNPPEPAAMIPMCGIFLSIHILHYITRFHLFYDAWRRGSLAGGGRLEPHTLSTDGCRKDTPGRFQFND